MISMVALLRRCADAAGGPLPRGAPGHGGLPRDEIGEQPQPRGLALLRVELHGEDVVARDRAGERQPVGARARGEAARAGLDEVAVHEVEAAALRYAVPQGVRLRLLDLVPAHVRHLEPAAVRVRHPVGGKPPHPPGSSPRPGVSPSSLRLEQHLQADADARGTACPRAASTTAARRPRASISRMQSGIAPWPGKTTRAAPRDRVRIARYRHLEVRRHVLDRLRHRAQVAHAVIDDGDVGHDQQSDE